MHRERVRTEVFGLDGDAGRDRYDGLLQLLHTLRAPDVGNRIDEGRLPQILLESLPPLHEEALLRAGEQLDGLTETRAAQERLENSAQQVATFLAVYQRYAAETLRSMARDTLAAADDRHRSRNRPPNAERTNSPRSKQESGHLQAAVQQLAEELAEIDHALRAIESREIFKTADDLVQRDGPKRRSPPRPTRRSPGPTGSGRTMRAPSTTPTVPWVNSDEAAEDAAAALAAARDGPG